LVVGFGWCPYTYKSANNLMSIFLAFVAMGNSVLAMVGVHLKSIDVFQNLKQMHGLTNGNWTRFQNRWLARFPLITIKLGSNNFLDALTPLNCLDFAISNTANML